MMVSSYAFLDTAGDPQSAIGNFGLVFRRATELRIHPTDINGSSQANFYDAVAVGDTFEFRIGAECFFRFRVTDLLAAFPTRRFAIEDVVSCPARCAAFDPSAPFTVEFEWHPLPGYLGPDGIRAMLRNEPVGQGTYRVMPSSPVVIDVPAGMQLMHRGSWITEPSKDGEGGMGVELGDVESGSWMTLNGITGEDWGRTVHESPARSAGESARDVNARCSTRSSRRRGWSPP